MFKPKKIASEENINPKKERKPEILKEKFVEINKTRDIFSLASPGNLFVTIPAIKRQLFILEFLEEKKVISRLHLYNVVKGNLIFALLFFFLIIFKIIF